MQERILFGVDQALKAIGNLAIPAKHTYRIQNVFTPGQAVSYTLEVYDVKVVLTSYSKKEIEDDRDAASDIKMLVFHEKAIPLLNDTITVQNKQYRVMRATPTYAGTEIAFSTVQARPLGA